MLSRKEAGSEFLGKQIRKKIEEEQRVPTRGQHALPGGGGGGSGGPTCSWPWDAAVRLQGPEWGCARCVLDMAAARQPTHTKRSHPAPVRALSPATPSTVPAACGHVARLPPGHADCNIPAQEAAATSLWPANGPPAARVPLVTRCTRRAVCHAAPRAPSASPPPGTSGWGAGLRPAALQLSVAVQKPHTCAHTRTHTAPCSPSLCPAQGPGACRPVGPAVLSGDSLRPGGAAPAAGPQPEGGWRT